MLQGSGLQVFWGFQFWWNDPPTNLLWLLNIGHPNFKGLLGETLFNFQWFRQDLPEAPGSETPQSFQLAA